jgi:preprotein translocase subunit Sec61beta
MLTFQDKTYYESNLSQVSPTAVLAAAAAVAKNKAVLLRAAPNIVARGCSR